MIALTDVASSAVTEACAAWYLGDNILASGFACHIVIHAGARVLHLRRRARFNRLL